MNRALIEHRGRLHLGALSMTGRSWRTCAGYLPVATATTWRDHDAVEHLVEHEDDLCPTCRDEILKADPHRVGPSPVPRVYQRRIAGWAR